jgi:ribosome-binding protein aMBF1 (putative translation factor)
MADGQVCWCELAFLLTTQRKLYDQRAGALSRSSQKSRIATGRTREQNRRARTFKSDRTLQMLVADLVAARTAAGMTQEEVAVRMWTTKSVVSRLESGVCTRPTLTTIEKYAVAVGAFVEIRVRTRR